MRRPPTRRLGRERETYAKRACGWVGPPMERETETTWRRHSRRAEKISEPTARVIWATSEDMPAVPRQRGILRRRCIPSPRPGLLGRPWSSLLGRAGPLYIRPWTPSGLVAVTIMSVTLVTRVHTHTHSASDFLLRDVAALPGGPSCQSRFQHHVCIIRPQDRCGLLVSLA